jgi:hypothetical protein
MANQKQLKLLKKDVEAWNKWRKENHEIDLSDADLSGVDLSYANLSWSNLNGVNLRKANLRKANLSGAYLIGANLSGANLSRANFSSANLSGANLSEADLRGSILFMADLSRVDLSLSNLSRANLKVANLSGANLREAIFSRANLSRANLSSTNLNASQLFQIEEGADYWRVAEEHYENLQIEGVAHAEDDSAMYESFEFYKHKRGEEVVFTAYHPKEGSVESWHTLLVYTHVSSALVKVQKDAKRFHDQIKSPKETKSKSSTPIVRGTELTIVPSCEGVTFNPEHISFKWLEDFQRTDFRFLATQSLSGDAAKGEIVIYVGPLIVGTLKFAMLFNDKDAHLAIEHEEHAKMYGEDDVFISYSRKDTEVARTFKNILEGTGLDVFLDVDDLRSGQLWEDELKRRIEHAKVFQIFWSANYSQSENCKLEWEYALQQNKDEGYIRPVFWEKPISPKPPEELNKFNFKYVELKV